MLRRVPSVGGSYRGSASKPPPPPNPPIRNGTHNAGITVFQHIRVLCCKLARLKLTSRGEVGGAPGAGPAAEAARASVYNSSY